MLSRNLALRIGSAAILAAASLAALVFSPVIFHIIIGAVCGLALYEWLSISRSHAWLSLVGVLYILFCVASFTICYRSGRGLPETVTLLGTVWLCDVGAYIAGHMIGGPRLIPAISPNKTWAGAIGGLVTPVVILTVLAYCSSNHSSSVIIAVGAVATLVALAAQVGDLLESAAKRHFGVKDSGWIMPGHGGILDRIDGLLLASPVALLLASLAGALS